MGVQVPPFALPPSRTEGWPTPPRCGSSTPWRHASGYPGFGAALRRFAVVATIALGGCADPGATALDRTIQGLDQLIVIAERRARGELDAAQTASAISAWQRSEGVEITSLSHDAARALGLTLRRALEARWNDRAGPLVERVRGLTGDFGGLR